MERVFIGIPVLNRLDLLERSVGCIDCPAETVVVNNTVSAEFSRDLSEMAKRRGFSVLPQRRNLGVSASWNLLLRTAWGRGYEWAFIGSNDAFVHPGSLAIAVSAAASAGAGVWHLHSWNLFLISRRTFEAVGAFDENFYPAYKEDEDYSRRCALANVNRADVLGAGAEHVGSATVRSDSVYWERNGDTQCRWNFYYYLIKWGGDAARERFQTPFDDPDKDHRWWPDPGESIAVRDWDNARRGGAS